MTNPTQLTAYDTSGKAQSAQSSTTHARRFFMVVVERCADCFHLHYSDNSGNQCLHESTPDSRDLRQAIYQQNKNAITESCPMWDQSQQEIEK